MVDVTLRDLATMGMDPADVGALNRRKREVAISGAAGTADVPYLYPWGVLGEAGTPADFMPDAAPPEDVLPGEDFSFDYFAPPGAEARPLSLAALREAAVSPVAAASQERLGGRGHDESMNLSAANPVTGIAQSYSPELEAFLADTFPGLMDPTTFGKVAPGVGTVMGIVESIQEEDPLGILGALAGAVAPLGLSTLSALAAGTPIDPSALGTAALQSQTNVSPLDLAQGVMSGGLETREQDPASGPTDPEIQARARAGEISAATYDPVTDEIGPQIPSGPQPGQRGYPNLRGLSGPESQAVLSGQTPADMNPAMAAGIAAAGYQGTPSGYIDEEDEDFLDLLEASLPASLAAQLASGSSVAANALAAAPASLRSLSTSGSSFGTAGGGSGSSSFGNRSGSQLGVSLSLDGGISLGGGLAQALGRAARSRSGGGGDSGSGGSSGGGGSGGMGCFIAGTKVTMADGTLKVIEDVALGDEVMAFEGDGPLVPRRVVSLFRHLDKPVIRINRGVTCTPEHPFYCHAVSSSGFGWRPAADVRIGDRLMSEHGEPVEVLSVEPAGVATVYNLEVEGLHTYVADDFRVHNIKHAGGYIHEGRVPGERRGDVPETLQEGEYVISADAVELLGIDTLEALNALGRRLRR